MRISIQVALAILLASTAQAEQISSYYNVIGNGSTCLDNPPVVAPGKPSKDCSVPLFRIPNGSHIYCWKITGRFYTHHVDQEIQAWLWNGDEQAYDSLTTNETHETDWFCLPNGEHIVAKDAKLMMRLFNEEPKDSQKVTSGTAHIRILWEPKEQP